MAYPITPHPIHDLVPISIAAALAGVSHSTIRWWASQRYVCAIKRPGKPLAITVESLANVLQSPISSEDIIRAAKVVRRELLAQEAASTAPSRHLYPEPVEEPLPPLRGNPPVYTVASGPLGARFHEDYKP